MYLYLTGWIATNDSWWIAWGMRRAAVSEANRRHCLAFVSHHHCEPFFKKGEAINVIAMGKARSNLVLDSGNSFWDCFTHCVHSQWRALHFVRDDDKARITEAIAKPVAARPERATADEIVNDILCRFKNLIWIDEKQRLSSCCGKRGARRNNK